VWRNQWAAHDAKNQSRLMPSRRKFPSNNYNRLLRFCSQIFTEPLYSSADDGPHPGDGGHDGFRATGAGNACAPGTTRCWPRSADGSSTDMLDRPSSQTVDAAAEAMHGPQGVECAWAQRAGAAWGPCHAGFPLLSEPSSTRAH
jgi:hypothetical protein